MKKINNEMYFLENQKWWDDDDNNAYAFLRHAVNPVRFGYFRRVIQGKLHKGESPLTILDVGCGGGFLSEEFAKIGCNVTGIDPSPVLLKAAREHAAENSLPIEYIEGYGEKIPFGNYSFDCVACCDVLEHVDDLDKVISEISRVLKPGGVFFYDTINRTFISYLLAIKFAQEWKFTRWEQPGTHVWHKFVKPVELTAIMAKHGLNNQELKGISPQKSPSSYLNIRKRAKGEISLREMGQRLRLHESSDTSVQYIGYAKKC